MATVSTTVTIEVVMCPTCGVHYGLDADFYAKARNDANMGWYCPNGHYLSFKKHIEEKDLNAQVLRLQQRLRQKDAAIVARDDQIEAERRSHAHTKGELTKTRKKVQKAEKGVCTSCHRSFADVRKHIESKHPEQLQQPERSLP